MRVEVFRRTDAGCLGAEILPGVLTIELPFLNILIMTDSWIHATHNATFDEAVEDVLSGQGPEEREDFLGDEHARSLDEV